MLYTLLTTLLIVDALFLIVFIVLLQQGTEGAGFGSSSSGNTGAVFGASGGARLIVRMTWIFGFLFFIIGLATAWTQTHERQSFAQSIERSLLVNPNAQPRPASPLLLSPPSSSSSAIKLPTTGQVGQ